MQHPIKARFRGIYPFRRLASARFAMAPNCDVPLDYKHRRSESFPLQSVCWAVYAHQRLLYAGLSIHCRSPIASSNDAACVYQSEKAYRHFSGWLPHRWIPRPTRAPFDGLQAELSFHCVPPQWPGLFFPALGATASASAFSLRLGSFCNSQRFLLSLLSFMLSPRNRKHVHQSQRLTSYRNSL
uniref:Uncharacterized protein n=1 Tax=Candidatus Kentrum sp. TC TaxID=2126339 RepID=A0A450ZE74_9GAMM|nr:MAG: hypothetical protein BECKTC1821D_GA0114238_11533 [Candidatus Kentron sp. TC]